MPHVQWMAVVEELVIPLECSNILCRYTLIILTMNGRTLGRCNLCGTQTTNPDIHWKSDTCKKM